MVLRREVFNLVVVEKAALFPPEIQQHRNQGFIPSKVQLQMFWKAPRTFFPCCLEGEALKCWRSPHLNWAGQKGRGIWTRLCSCLIFLSLETLSQRIGWKTLFQGEMSIFSCAHPVFVMLLKSIWFEAIDEELGLCPDSNSCFGTVIVLASPFSGGYFGSSSVFLSHPPSVCNMLIRSLNEGLAECFHLHWKSSPRYLMDLFWWCLHSPPENSLEKMITVPSLGSGNIWWCFLGLCREPCITHLLLVLLSHCFEGLCFNLWLLSGRE